jgi:hypothetical protein
MVKNLSLRKMVKNKALELGCGLLGVREGSTEGRGSWGRRLPGLHRGLGCTRPRGSEATGTRGLQLADLGWGLGCERTEANDTRNHRLGALYRGLKWHRTEATGTRAGPAAGRSGLGLGLRAHRSQRHPERTIACMAAHSPKPPPAPKAVAGLPCAGAVNPSAPKPAPKPPPPP